MKHRQRNSQPTQSEGMCLFSHNSEKNTFAFQREQDSHNLNLFWFLLNVFCVCLPSFLHLFFKIDPKKANTKQTKTLLGLMSVQVSAKPSLDVR